jgi:hypothetical protein
MSRLSQAEIGYCTRQEGFAPIRSLFVIAAVNPLQPSLTINHQARSSATLVHCGEVAVSVPRHHREAQMGDDRSGGFRLPVQVEKEAGETMQDAVRASPHPTDNFPAAKIRETADAKPYGSIKHTVQAVYRRFIQATSRFAISTHSLFKR